MVDHKQIQLTYTGYELSSTLTEVSEIQRNYYIKKLLQIKKLLIKNLNIENN